MPLFLFRCNDCGEEQEHLISSHEFPKILSELKCIKCGSKKLTRIYGGSVGLIFKGPGFYSTDYKKTTEKE